VVELIKDQNHPASFRRKPESRLFLDAGRRSRVPRGSSPAWRKNFWLST